MGEIIRQASGRAWARRWFAILGATTLVACTVDGDEEHIGTVQQELTPFSPVLPFGIDDPNLQELVPYGPTGIQVLSWRVKHDNPWVGADYTLRSSSDPNVLTGAERGNDVWRYDFFDISAGLNDVGGGLFLWPAVGTYRTALVWPQTVGFFQGAGTRVPWEAHGLRLDPLGTAAKVEPWEDDWQNPNVHWNNEDGFLHLDPNVKVVPVVTVVVWGDERSPGPEGACCYPALSHDRVTEKDSRAFFDDDWSGQRHPSSSPGYSPEDVVGEWNTTAGCANGTVCASNFTASTSVDGTVVQGGQFYQPDRIFDQCSVQFREIAHIKCHAPPDVLHPSAFACPTSSQALADANKVRGFVEKNCLPKGRLGNIIPEYDDAMKVVFMGQFSRTGGGTSCQDGEIRGANIPNTTWVFVTNRASKGVVSHEIGHALGLEHIAQSGSVCSDSENLMCASVHGSLPGLHEITAEQCEKTWESAASIHNGYW